MRCCSAKECDGISILCKALEDDQSNPIPFSIRCSLLNTPMYSSKMVHINQSLDEVYECDFECKYRNHSSKLRRQYRRLHTQVNPPLLQCIYLIHSL